MAMNYIDKNFLMNCELLVQIKPLSNFVKHSKLENKYV